MKKLLLLLILFIPLFSLSASYPDILVRNGNTYTTTSDTINSLTAQNNTTVNITKNLVILNGITIGNNNTIIISKNVTIIGSFNIGNLNNITFNNVNISLYGALTLGEFNFLLGSADIPVSGLIKLGTTSFINPIVKIHYYSLPIELLSFYGYNYENTNYITWKTASELDNNYFILLKSSDCISFTVLDTIKGSGTSNTVNTYTYIDLVPYTPNTYYNLKQIDYNGTITDKGIILINENTGPIKVNIYPNPTNSEITITFSDKYSIVKIYDLLGKLMFEREVFGFNSLSINLKDYNFVPGIYIVTVNEEKIKLLIK